MFTPSLRSVVIAATLAAASVAAHADIAINAYLDFDSVASGSTANDYISGLGLGSALSFGNADTQLDAPVYDSVGHILNDGAFHWIDATATYGDVLVKNDGTAVSGSNVLWNDHQPILVQFAGPVNIASFSVQQDSSTYGNPQDNGSAISFLDSTGHVISGADVNFTQYNHPGLTISSGAVANVSAILLTAGKSYDNLSITTAAAVPEPSSWLMLGAGVGLLGFIGRRRAG